MSIEKLETIDGLQSKLLNAYREKFPNDRPNICAFAPGRANLIGEHSDYNHTFVFPMGIAAGTMVLGSEINDENDKTCYFQTLSGEFWKTVK